MKYVCQTMEHFKELASDMDVVLFGSGEYCMRFMNRIGTLTDRIKYILDNDSRKHGGRLYGIPIVCPERMQAMNAESTLVVITVETSIPQIYEQISAMGDYTVMAGRILMNDILSTVAEELYHNRHLTEKTEELLYDDASKAIYREVIRRRMLYGECDFSDLVIRGDAEYRAPFMFCERKPEEEVILDCGAYEGDTLKKFVNTYGPTLKKIYLFECMEEALKKLEKAVDYLRQAKYVPEIAVMKYALSDHVGKAVFGERAKGGSFIVENRAFAKDALYESDYVEVKVSTIDLLIPEDEKVTMIKMDIEGSEYEAILGAKRVIQTYKPRLAISIYHSGKDYYRLAFLVKELVPEYKIAVRHHNKNHCDTDMYCWI